MKISLIVAKSTNNAIGINNQLPWKISEDLQYFKKVTTGKPIIMGRKTFESIGRPLPNRTNIVLTRDDTWSAEGVVVVKSLHEAVQAASKVHGAKEAMIVGGAQIYDKALPLVDRMYITEVHEEVQGDTFFATITPRVWDEVSREDHDNGEYKFSFIVMDRK